MEKTETKKIPQLVFIKGICDFCRKQEDIIEIEIFDEKRKICIDCLVNFNMSLKKKLKRRMYDNLQEFFKSIPQQQEQVALNLSEFTNIMGPDLPNTAYKDRPWWANTASSPQGNSWLSAGWELENIYLHAKVAVFRRKSENPFKNIPRYMKAILDGRPHIMQPPAHMLIGWIRFCRKVGWYFEGTVLYERGGLSLDSLSEAERTEVDEDYSVCKRELTRYKNEKNV